MVGWDFGDLVPVNEFIAQLETIHWMVFGAFATWLGALSWIEYNRRAELVGFEQRLSNIEASIAQTLSVLNLVEYSEWKMTVDNRIASLEKSDCMMLDIKPMLNDKAWKSDVDGKLKRLNEVMKEAKDHGGHDHSAMHDRISKWSHTLREELAVQQRQITDLREGMAAIKGQLSKPLST